MAKLGKRAKKFARKNLQSVAKRQRLHRARILKRSAPRKGSVAVEEEEQVQNNDASMVVAEEGSTVDVLEDLFLVNDDDINEDISDDEGYLSEDPQCPYISEDENENSFNEGTSMDIALEIKQKKKQLEKLRRKDPKFGKFLERRLSECAQRQREYADEDDALDSTDVNERDNGQSSGKAITSTTVDVWCWLSIEEPNGPGLRNLLNAFKTAGQLGIDYNAVATETIQNAEIYSKILLFVLSEADGIFCKLLPNLSSSRKNFMKLASSSEWQAVSSLMKSYLLSSLDLLNQLTDNQMLIFVLSRLQVSIIFFAAFPSLARRFVKILVHLWATGEEKLSLCAYFAIKEIALQFPSDWLDICLRMTYSRFLVTCKLVDSTRMKHIELLMGSLTELYSLDIQKSCEIALTSLLQIRTILRKALKTKNEEELRKIHSWQYIFCIKLWVKIICSNYKQQDLQPLLSLVIDVIRGIAHLFTGPRYFPLRFKCVQMLNELSACSGLFIPVASMVFDFLDLKDIRNTDQVPKSEVKFSSLLKVTKSLLKTRGFQEECIRSAIELLSAHFVQWSHHVSFPELATVPLIICKRLYASLTIDSLRRPLKRFIDEVSENRDYMLRKREEISFSPSDQASIDGLSQLEKSNPNHSFTQYYSTVLQKSSA